MILELAKPHTRWGQAELALHRYIQLGNVINKDTGKTLTQIEKCNSNKPEIKAKTKTMVYVTMIEQPKTRRQTCHTTK